MESDNFEFRAPQYIDDLGNVDTSQEEADKYFESLEEVSGANGFSTPNGQRSQREELFLTPFEDLQRESKEETTERTFFKAVRRKSLQPQTEKPIRSQREVEEPSRLTFDGITLSGTRGKEHPMVTRKDEAEASLSLRHRLVSRKRKCDSPSFKPPTKYISLAESIYRFQVLTPPRFHTSTCTSPPKLIKEKLKLTIPVTPKLETRERAKLAEAHKHDLEVLSAPGSSSQSQRPSPEIRTEALDNTHGRSGQQSHSRNQTAKEKEAKDTKVEPYHFKAREVPKSIYTGPRQIRVPAGKVDNSGAPSGILERSQALLERREGAVKKILEDEKKQRGQFHATPLPSFLASRLPNRSVSTVDSTRSFWNSTINSTAYSHSCMGDSPRYQFRAREAVVLKKKPFEPKKAERTLCEVSDYELNTERRARERMEFDQKMKEKEELENLRKKEEEEVEKEAIAKETARWRKAMVHQAQPLPSFYAKRHTKHN